MRCGARKCAAVQVLYSAGFGEFYDGEDLLVTRHSSVPESTMEGPEERNLPKEEFLTGSVAKTGQRQKLQTGGDEVSHLPAVQTGVARH